MSLIVTLAIVCLLLLIAQFYFVQMGETRVESAVRKVRKDLAKGRVDRAERRLYNSMRFNGWNYEGYLNARSSSKTLNIEQVAPFITHVGRALRLLPKNSFPWMIHPFLLLGEIYTKQGKTTKALRLFDDVTNFFEGYGEDVPYASRCWYFSQIHHQQALFEINAKNNQSAARYLAASYVERWGHLKGAGNEAEAADMVPYVADETMSRVLESMDPPREVPAIEEIITRYLRNVQGRINSAVLLREIDSFFAGTVAARTSNEAELHAARDIIHRALSKAAEQDRTKRDDEEEDRPKTIILGE